MHIHLDLVGGIAGDMFLAAAIDAGIVDVDPLCDALRTLGLGHDVAIDTEHARRGAIAGTHVSFRGWDPAHDADHRHLSNIEQMIADSGLETNVKDRAISLFRILGESEAKIHDIPIERVHFHEVGAVDSILDFVSAAWLIEHLDATWSVGEVPAGRGTIVTAHGEIPVPAPATADLLRGMTIVQRDVQAELVTPTGAAILRGLMPAFERREGSLREVGYGLGTRDPEGISNVLRMMVFEERAADAELERDTVVRIETEIDDMNPEVLAGVVDSTLPAAGAVDVVRTPVQMKKGRGGTRVTVLCEPERQADVVRSLFRHTTTFGLRIETVERLKLTRRSIRVSTEWGSVTVKLGVMGDEIVQRSPEYEDCREIARRGDVPVERVWRAALRAADDADAPHGIGA